MIHLTNDAVQNKAADYGKFEKGNKRSYNEFQKYLDTLPQEGLTANLNFMRDAYPKMRQLTIDAIRATYGKIDPKHREFGFELFGLDFMIDENMRVFLLEINTNPCLDATCPVLARIIPNVVDNALRVALDPVFPPPTKVNWTNTKKHLIPDSAFVNNKFEMVFDECTEGKQLRQLHCNINA